MTYSYLANDFEKTDPELVKLDWINSSETKLIKKVKNICSWLVPEICEHLVKNVKTDIINAQIKLSKLNWRKEEKKQLIKDYWLICYWFTYQVCEQKVSKIQDYLLKEDTNLSTEINLVTI